MIPNLIIILIKTFSLHYIFFVCVLSLFSFSGKRMFSRLRLSSNVNGNTFLNFNEFEGRFEVHGLINHKQSAAATQTTALTSRLQRSVNNTGISLARFQEVFSSCPRFRLNGGMESKP